MEMELKRTHTALLLKNLSGFALRYSRSSVDSRLFIHHGVVIDSSKSDNQKRLKEGKD